MNFGVEPITPAKLYRPGQEVKTFIVHRGTKNSRESRRNRLGPRERQSARMGGKARGPDQLASSNGGLPKAKVFHLRQTPIALRAAAL
jgi:hypothetical protein